MNHIINISNRHIINTKKCRFCNKFEDLTLKICKKCRSVRYCSKQHQIDDWNRHKPECRKLEKKRDYKKQMALVGLKKEDFEQWKVKAIENNDGLAYFNVALYYQHGFGIDSNISEAIKWYEEAVMRNVLAANLNLANIFCHGDEEFDISINYEKACFLYKMASDSMIDEAQTRLGYMYMYGYGVKKDEREAIRLYHLAAEKKNKNAEYYLGQAFLYGKGVVKDTTNAEKWFKLAAENGHEDAQFDLGVIYLRGEFGINENKTEAVQLFQLSAAQGNSGASHNLAYCYWYGDGILKNESKAIELLKLNANLGYVMSQHMLSRLYWEGGNEIIKNDQEAIRWCIKAAKQGHIDSLRDITCCFLEGKGGVEQDISEAFKWIEISINNGDDFAKEFYEWVINEYLIETQVL